jgi:predicted MFS family arabinose efflux permease
VKPWQRVALAMFAVGWGANQFSSLLIAYRDEVGMPTQVRAFLFGVYAAGLIPSLMLGGGASDRWGRFRVVMPAVVLSPVATLVLVVAQDSVALLTIGRLLAGVCSGVVFSSASAWVAELASDDDAPGAAARRAAIALTLGFGLGPMATGFVAEWAPSPLTIPYVPHLVLGAIAVLVLLPMARATEAPRGEVRPLFSIPAVTRSRRFLSGVAPIAPWVFGCAAISFAFLPGEVRGSGSGDLAFAGVLAGVTLGPGVLAQPLARRLDDSQPLRAGQLGLIAAMIGIGVGIVALEYDARWVLLLAGPVLGAGYGCCLVSGLRETERLSPPDQRGATVAVFYALTYLGFAAPYVLGGLADLGPGVRELGNSGALGLTAAAALVCLVIVTTNTASNDPVER